MAQVSTTVPTELQSNKKLVYKSHYQSNAKRSISKPSKIEASQLQSKSASSLTLKDSDKFKRRSFSGPATMSNSLSSTSKRPNSLFYSSSSINLGHMNNTFNKLDNELRKSHTTVTIDGNDFQIIVPTLVYKCCNFIESNPPVEGIFRINGAIKKIKLIEKEIQSLGIDKFDFNTCRIKDDKIDNIEATSYDAAMVLKRWLANLDHGLITQSVNKKLKSTYHHSSDEETSEVEKYSKDYDRNSDHNNTKDEIEDDTIITEEPHSATDDLSTSSINISETENGFSSVSATTSSTSISESKSKDVIYLSRLPIENIHLFIYLLKFLKKLSKPEIVEVTKMHSSNLAKIFQLSFFKSDDLTSSHSMVSSDGFLNSSLSAENLMESYKINENFLCSWINDTDNILKGLKPIILSKYNEFNDSLKLPYVETTAIPVTQLPDNKKTDKGSLSVEKKRNRRSVLSFIGGGSRNPSVSSLSIDDSVKSIEENSSSNSDNNTIKNNKQNAYNHRSSFSISTIQSGQVLEKPIKFGENAIKDVTSTQITIASPISIPTKNSIVTTNVKIDPKTNKHYNNSSRRSSTGLSNGFRSIFGSKKTKHNDAKRLSLLATPGESGNSGVNSDKIVEKEIEDEFVDMDKDLPSEISTVIPITPSKPSPAEKHTSTKVTPTTKSIIKSTPIAASINTTPTNIIILGTENKTKKTDTILEPEKQTTKISSKPAIKVKDTIDNDKQETLEKAQAEKKQDKRKSRRFSFFKSFRS